MQKIREIVKQIGGSDQLADQLVEAVEGHVGEERKKLQEEFQAKIQQAKQVCLREVAEEKQRMARKIEIFIESKVAAIERSAGKTRAIEESAAVAALRQVRKALGVDDGNSAELQALQRKLARIAEQTAALKEERDLAVDKANKANAIAVKALRRVRLQEAQEVTPEPAKVESTEATPEATPEAKPAEELQSVRVETEEPVTTMVSKADVPPPQEESVPAAQGLPSPDQIASDMGEQL